MSSKRITLRCTPQFTAKGSVRSIIVHRAPPCAFRRGPSAVFDLPGSAQRPRCERRRALVEFVPATPPPSRCIGPLRGPCGAHRASLRTADVCSEMRRGASCAGAPVAYPLLYHVHEPRIYKRRLLMPRLLIVCLLTPRPLMPRLSSYTAFSYTTPPHTTPSHRMPPPTTPPHTTPSHRMPPHRTPPHRTPPHRMPPHTTPTPN